MKFEIELCSMLIMTNGKKERVEEIEVPNQKSNRILGEKESYKCLGKLEETTIKPVEMKEKKINSTSND